MRSIPPWPPVPIWKNTSKSDLSTSFALLKALGNPHNNLPPTIHVAGTNGKGSSLAMLRSIFIKGGYKVHTYTSPHLVEFNERINLANIPITDSQLEYYLGKTKEAAEQNNVQPTFFEGITAAAFLAFSEIKADVLLLETGLGGRLDCTNVVTAPLATIITPISYDHMEFLGHDIKQIALEKAGIIKANVPCIIGPQVREVQEVLIDACSKMNAPSFCYEFDYIAQKTNSGFQYSSQKYNLELPAPNLLGDHQILNAASVIATILLINEKFRITNDQIASGITSAYWPGRIQAVDAQKILKLTGRDDIKIFLDGAHNDGGAQVLAHWAQQYLSGPIYGPIFLILGMTRKRNATSFCSYFKDIVHCGIAVGVESEPSSYNASILAENASKSGIDFSASDSLLKAIDQIASNFNTPVTIIITGSLFLVADYLNINI